MEETLKLKPSAPYIVDADSSGQPLWETARPISHEPESLQQLVESGFVVFRYSLDEDCWIGRAQGNAYKIYLHKWKEIPYQHANLYGHQLRCVRPADLQGIVAMPEKAYRTEPEKIRRSEED